MTRKRHSITASSEIVNNIAEQAKMTFDLQAKLIHWLAEDEQKERKFRYAMINKISRVESMISLLLVDHMARNQIQPPFCTKEQLEKDAKTTEEFISEHSQEIGKNIVDYLAQEEPKPEVRHDQRRKWHGWEI